MDGIADERSSTGRADPHASRDDRARRRPNGALIQGRARRGQSRFASAVPMLGAEPGQLIMVAARNRKGIGGRFTVALCDGRDEGLSQRKADG